MMGLLAQQCGEESGLKEVLVASLVARPDDGPDQRQAPAWAPSEVVEPPSPSVDSGTASGPAARIPPSTSNGGGGRVAGVTGNALLWTAESLEACGELWRLQPNVDEDLLALFAAMASTSGGPAG